MRVETGIDLVEVARMEKSLASPPVLAAGFFSPGAGGGRGQAQSRPVGRRGFCRQRGLCQGYGNGLPGDTPCGN